MNQIGFKNFRKFKELAPIDLAPVTIFVGENNAGKSTVVKAILSLLDFLNTRVNAIEDKSWVNIKFYFNNSYYTHLGTFDRAHNNKTSTNDPITFILTTGNRRYEIDVKKSSSSESDVYGDVSRIKVTFLPLNIDITFLTEGHKNEMKITFHTQSYPGFVNDVKRTSLSDRSLKNYFRGLTKDIIIDSYYNTDINFIAVNIVDALMMSFNGCISDTYDLLNPKKVEKSPHAFYNLPKETIDFLLKRKSILAKINSIERNFDVEYIYAHAVTQTVLYSAKDTNDYHVKTVHEFANKQIEKGSILHSKIEEWMQEFNIGQDYDIKSIGGEAHIVKIQNFDNEWVNLSDKGMGSIQLMILFFRVATKIAESDSVFNKRKYSNTLLIIEEPEQNLHPLLQSKLADFFERINKDYGFYFIVETHSEYLIRKTQVIINKENKNSSNYTNPFKVVYFPGDDKAPYDMLYRKDGKFSNEFGAGFFDEAANLAFEIF